LLHPVNAIKALLIALLRRSFAKAQSARPACRQAGFKNSKYIAEFYGKRQMLNAERLTRNTKHPAE